ncbi:tyrosine--tRNA ligase [Limnoglobus roseus]|uniref:Tyrosine--tRNA ligase n=1 Tax=Limnoglobus roseus TaxID=2598579 RepID=A0A5C1AJ20_9BACT|nr:tyrosine--tRNA ligase [Limnoglobus roseus]QEL18147.1 tyrosine--tRNA ligase [Limnoglobus roseus]
MSSFRPVEEQLSILLRGASHVEKSAELRQKLERSFKTGKPLRVKYGIDPTGFDVHLGHTVPLRKLRQFQELGHTAVLIIGTATAMVGDPSGRDESRKGLDAARIEQNAENYLTQIAKVVDTTKAEVVRNDCWFGKWTFADMLRLLGRATVQQLLAREDFSNRFRAEPSVPIYLHECLYPLLQGWDSVEIQADVELGGTEQLFNLMVGRDLQREVGQEPQVCLTLPILRGTDGVKKMGKSVGNYIGVGETAKEQFGKTMRIPDDLMREWFELLTDVTSVELQTILDGKPNEAKKRLGAEVVKFYYGDSGAEHVLAEWKRQFETGGDPEQIPDVSLKASDIVDGAMPAIKLIVMCGFCKSNNEARQKIKEGAFNYGPDRAKPVDEKATVPVADGLIARLGRKLVRVKLV